MTTKNKIIETVQNENPDKKVKMNIIGNNISTKFTEAVHSNKEFIKALIFIGKNIEYRAKGLFAHNCGILRYISHDGWVD